MKGHLTSTLMILLLLFVAAVPAAYAVLQQVGPVDNSPSIGGYPKWYQDTTGLALEFCDPQNAAEVAGGWCLLGPLDVPVAPEVFPGAFADEHFWYSAETSIDLLNNPDLRTLLVLAVEAAFVGAVEPGGQMAFSRIRYRLDPVPVSGIYRFINPYSVDLIEGVAGERIFFTDDVGLSPLVFTEALTSRLGPFLLPSALPGGGPACAGQPVPCGELPAVQGPIPPGLLYIADPGRSGPVTGSALPPFVACPNSNPCTVGTGGTLLDHNRFRIEGPVGSNLDGLGNDFIETTDFSLMGRIFQGAIAGRVTVDRASYERPDAQTNKIDVFATAFPSTQGRIPPNPTPAVTIPNLVFYDGPCFDPITGEPALAGLTSSQMFFAGSNYWGQSAPAAIPQNPAEVCVVQTNALDAGGQPTVAFFPAPLDDKVDITEALFTPATQTLSVRAISRDVVGAPTLTVAGFGDINPATGQLLFTPLTAPPGKVTVHSSQGGSNEFQVNTSVGPTGPGVGVPVAANDAVTIAEDSGATSIGVLANDTVDGNPIPPGPPAPIITIVDPPLLGNAVVVPGSPPTLPTINYTPNLNATGTDNFTYTVTVGGVASNQAIVTVTITPVNDLPTANDDSATANTNVLTPINVLANDTDPDGAADIVAVANLTQPTPATASVALNGTTVNFTATAAGTYTFTYQAQDAALALSNVATVTVTVTVPETITATARASRNGSGTAASWDIRGLTNLLAPHTMTVTLTRTGQLIGSATTSTAGQFKLAVTSSVVPVPGDTITVTSSLGTSATFPVAVR